MPVSERAVPAHRVQPGRSWPSHAESRLDGDGRASEDEGAVAGRRAGDAADEEVLVEPVAQHRQANNREPVPPRDRAHRADEAVTPADEGEKHDRGQHHAQAVEGRARHLAQRRLDDREVAAPEERHQEQPGVEAGNQGHVLGAGCLGRCRMLGASARLGKKNTAPTRHGPDAVSESTQPGPEGQQPEAGPSRPSARRRAPGTAGSAR